MHELIHFDGKVVKPTEALIGAAASASLYGRGIFTTIAIHKRAPFLWEKHWRRLERDSAAVGVEVSGFTQNDILSSLSEILNKNVVIDGRARITFFNDSAGSTWQFDREAKTRVLITTAEPRPLPDHFRLSISPYRINTTSPLIGIKSCNYLEHLLAFEEAAKRDFHEAVRMNERGEVASACMANIFWSIGDKLFTPSLKTGCLAGTTREYILENVGCEEVETGTGVIDEADRIFLTSAGIGLAAVAEFDGRSLDTSGDPLSSLLPF